MDDKELDRLLDRSLAEYGPVSPRVGLEQRILANLEAQKTQRNGGWRWAWVVPAVAAILLAISFVGRQSKAPEKVAIVTAPTAPIVAPIPQAGSRVAPHPALRRGHRVAAAHVKASPQPEPRLATFPSGNADVAQAQLLLRFVRQSPDTARAVLKDQEDFRAIVARNEGMQYRSEQP